MRVKGKVLRIERSSSYDGEGLRTVIFLKGCPLSCMWCSTPESQKYSNEIGCDDSKCIRCGLCVRACPNEALRLDSAGLPRVVDDKCTACGVCAQNCPSQAITIYGRDMTAEEVVRELEKDSILYFHSQGGVTFSGGEPLAQPEFVAEVLRLAANHGINGTIETSVSVPWRNIDMVLKWVPKIFVDIKHMDPIHHKNLTGISNDLILENIKKIDDYGTKLSVRIPIIPSVNDSESNIEATAVFCNQLNNIVELELLSYHKLGMTTYKRLGMKMKLDKVDPPSNDHMLGLASKIKSVLRDGVVVKVNGVVI